MSDRIRVLYVDAGSDDGKTTAEHLEGMDDRIGVSRVGNPKKAFERLETEAIDCVLSGYRIPGTDGIEFFSEIRDRWPKVPFVLYARDGSEETAAEAIAEGVTEYVPERSTTESYERLADRIVAATEKRPTTGHERVADVVRGVQSDLVRARTREDVDTAVCELLVDADPYVFAWIGEADANGKRVQPRASAGREAGYLEAADVTIDEETTGQGPTGRAIRTRSIQVSQDVSEDPTYNPWRDDALERGYRSSAAIPIEHEGRLYGVLNVYADRPNAFSADERSLLADLGETIAHVYHRIRAHEQYESQYRTLFEDAPVMMAFTRETGEGPIVEDCNQRFANKLGYSPKELGGRPLSELYSDESAEQLLNGGGYAQALEGAFTTKRREFVTADGERLVALLQATPRRDDHGETVGTHALYVDITERERMESVLEQVEAMEASIDGMAIIDENSEYIYANDAHAEIYGYDDPDELIGNTWRMVYEDDEIERFETEIMPDLEGGPGEWRGEATGLRADGSSFPQEVSMTRLEDGRTVCVVRDVTERKKREQELQQFREAVEQTAHAVYITDSDGTIEYVNPAFEEITGYSESDAIGRTPRILKSGEYGPEFCERFWGTINAGEQWESEIIDRQSDGEDVVLHQTVSPITDEDGEPRKFVAVAQDVTNRKEYEEALERSHEELRRIIDLVPDLIAAKNRAGEFILANEATADAYGSTPEAIEGMREADVIPNDEEAETFREDDLEVIESGESKHIAEGELTTADGETLIFQTTKIPYEIPGSGESAVLAYARDVTELKEYEHRLESQRDNLELLNQVVRHDIRNDMTIVHGHAKLLEEHLEADGQGDLETILEASEEAIELTETARDLSKTMLSTEEDVEPVCLDSHLREPIETARSESDNTVVTVEGDVSDVYVRGNELLEAVFRNLIQNAVVHNDKRAPTVHVSTELDEEIVTVAVADNGPGIPDDRKETVFGKGEKGLDSPGTGIGLYLVRTLVEQYGGDVWVEDNDPEGSVFYVELPRNGA